MMIGRSNTNAVSSWDRNSWNSFEYVWYCNTVCNMTISRLWRSSSPTLKKKILVLLQIRYKWNVWFHLLKFTKHAWCFRHFLLWKLMNISWDEMFIHFVIHIYYTFNPFAYFHWCNLKHIWNHANILYWISFFRNQLWENICIWHENVIWASYVTNIDWFRMMFYEYDMKLYYENMKYCIVK